MKRSEYIGGADAAAILGNNDYATLLKVWRKKTGREADEASSNHIDRGVTMEPIIEAWVRDNLSPDMNSFEMFERFGTDQAIRNLKEWYGNTAEGMGLDITEGSYGYIYAPQRPQITVRHKKYPFCGGHPDGLDRKTVWEFKAPTMRKLKRLEGQGIDITWMIQVNYYMWITDLPEAKVAVWDYDEWKPMIVKLKPNREWFRLFNDLMPKFWECVENDVEPDPADFYCELGIVPSNEHLDVLLSEYVDATSMRYEGEGDQKAIKTQIMTALGAPGKYETDNFTISASEQKRFGTTFVRLTVKEKQTPEATTWLSELRREQAEDKIAELQDFLAEAETTDS